MPSSLAEARSDPDARPRAVYAGGRVVGFLMYDAGEPDDEPREALIYRFMIDRTISGQRIRPRRARAGRWTKSGRSRASGGLSISYMPDNPVAKPFYASFGFVEVGTDEDGEMIAELAL